LPRRAPREARGASREAARAVVASGAARPLGGPRGSAPLLRVLRDPERASERDRRGLRRSRRGCHWRPARAPRAVPGRRAARPPGGVRRDPRSRSDPDAGDAARPRLADTDRRAPQGGEVTMRARWLSGLLVLLVLLLAGILEVAWGQTTRMEGLEKLSPEERAIAERNLERWCSL